MLSDISCIFFSNAKHRQFFSFFFHKKLIADAECGNALITSGILLPLILEYIAKCPCFKHFFKFSKHKSVDLLFTSEQSLYWNGVSFTTQWFPFCIFVKNWPQRHKKGPNSWDYTWSRRPNRPVRPGVRHKNISILLSLGAMVLRI